MLTDKIAVISGGSRGIGKAIADKLAQEGADCLLAARSQENLEAAAQQIRNESGRRIEICATDLRTLSGCEEVHKLADSAFGRVDILVNCAGATQGGLFLEQDDAVWQDGFALKFYGAVRLSRLFWPMLTESHGTVINIIGGFARTPDPDFMIGGAVNAAFANFSKALAGLGLRDDVNVNAIHPGLTVTERLEEIFEGRAKLAGTTAEEAKAATIAKEGIRQLGQPEDVAALAYYLCTPQARHIQGVAISIDGGATAGVY
ncbi:SDR family NAD(P)-dependent oxidoreductase [Chloroflexi bacterium TSY]|nr:SDR family NAD(P)-dependent oxidoreductase [Chloroflexi bacterium TSY]